MITLLRDRYPPEMLAHLDRVAAARNSQGAEGQDAQASPVRTDVLCGGTGGCTLVTFKCPGCGLHHTVSTGRSASPRWDWNGSMDKPTFNPSILARMTWGPDRALKVCHSFVRDGHIEFLGDSTHALAGKTVPLAPYDPSVTEPTWT